jgi:hypothetical protein
VAGGYECRVSRNLGALTYWTKKTCKGDALHFINQRVNCLISHYFSTVPVHSGLGCLTSSVPRTCTSVQFRSLQLGRILNSYKCLSFFLFVLS